MNEHPTWRLVSVELDEEFRIVSDTGEEIATPITRKSAKLARWSQKKVPARALWESVATERERDNIRLMCSAPRLRYLLEQALPHLQAGDAPAELLAAITEQLRPQSALGAA